MKPIRLLFSLPDDWSLVPIKVVCTYKVSNVDKHSFQNENPVRLCNYTDVYHNDFVSPDLELMKATATEEEIKQFHLSVGDVVITKDSESWKDIAIPAYITATADDFLCGYHLAIIHPDANFINGRFLFRCMQARPVMLQLELEATGVTRFGISKNALGSTLIPLPSFAIQELIANYLDRETARIDALIAEKGEMLQLLEEKRSVLISTAVTRGLNPNAKMKPSGLDWLGEIPAHWDLKKLKYITDKIGSGVTPRGGAEIYQSEGIPFLRSQNIHFNGLRLKDVVYITPETHADMPNSQVLSGDVLLNITGASIGRCYYVDSSLDEANVNQHVCIIRPNKEILTQYTNYILRSTIGQIQIDSSQSGSGREGLNFEALGNFSIPVPRKDEQESIIEFLEEGEWKFCSLVETIKNSIELLNMRRIALITAAVTGQIPIEEMSV